MTTSSGSSGSFSRVSLSSEPSIWSSPWLLADAYPSLSIRGFRSGISLFSLYWESSDLVAPIGAGLVSAIGALHGVSADNSKLSPEGDPGRRLLSPGYVILAILI